MKKMTENEHHQEEEGPLKKIALMATVVAFAVSATWFIASENSQRALSIQSSRVEVRLLKESIDRSIATNEELLQKLQRMETYIVSIDYQLKAVCQEVTALREELGVHSATSVCKDYKTGPTNPFSPTRFPQEKPEPILTPALYNKSDKGRWRGRHPYVFS